MELHFLLDFFQREWGAKMTAILGSRVTGANNEVIRSHDRLSLFAI